MPQTRAWEAEYQKPVLMTKDERPQNFLIQTIKYLKKVKKQRATGWQVLDLGCGTGRNSNYLGEKDNQVVGIDIASNALKLGEARALKLGLNSKVKYLKQSIGEVLPFADKSFDLILDITASNSLNNREREIYLKEAWRVLKPGRIMILRALCKDGDHNAQELLKISPGKEVDTYFIKALKITERVFSESDLRSLYGRYFIFDKLEKSLGYPQLKGRIYKRKYWQAVLLKK